MVTSLMTYWYPGGAETIQHIKAVWPDTPIVLGGIYATLCREHALENINAEHVHSGSGEHDLLKLAGRYTGFNVDPAACGFDPHNLDTYPYPAFDLQSTIPYIPLLTSRGCPFACVYCASAKLNPQRQLRDPALVVEEIKYWHTKYNIKDFAIYDDAFLFQAQTHAVPILNGIIQSKLKIRFHTPNALHLRWISKEIAALMFEAGFQTIRLGLETTDFDSRTEMDKKVSAHEFKRAVSHLKAAGFQKDQLGAYLLAGLPGQPMAAIADSIQAAKEAGITPIPAYYSPIPHTPLWEKAVAHSRYKLKSDPVFTNNALLPCQQEPFAWGTISDIKKLVAQ